MTWFTVSQIVGSIVVYSHTTPAAICPYCKNTTTWGDETQYYLGDPFSDEPAIAALVERGLMEYAGQKAFVPDPYYRITAKGREALRAAKFKPNSDSPTKLPEVFE